MSELYFGNIPEEMTVEDLKAMFKPFGEIKYLILFKDNKGNGKMCFKDTNEACVGETPANMAIKAMKDTQLSNGKKMYIRFNL